MSGLSTFILPGISNSGPEHWQSYWERQDPHCRRIIQAEWERPRCADWVATLDRAVAEAEGDIVLVAHSSACALVAHWAGGAAPEQLARVRGALLVGPSDPEGPNYPVGPSGFAPMPRGTLPFPTIVVASRDDVYVSLEQARAYADSWGSRVVDVGNAGHINSASNLGAWPAGYALLEELRREAFVRQAIELSRLARAAGNHPFGALLVVDGQVMLTAQNTVTTDGDPTAHAETNLVSQAIKRLSPDEIRRGILYTSCEPCAMCVGKMYWAGVRSLVYALPAEELAALAGRDFLIPCAELFGRAEQRVSIAGPMLVNEAREVHLGFWSISQD